MRQFEIREVISDALVIIQDCETFTEAVGIAQWWTREFGTVCYAVEVVK